MKKVILVSLLGCLFLTVCIAVSLLGYSIVEEARVYYWVFVDREGKRLPGVFKYGSSFSEGLAAVQEDRLWGYINLKGEWVIPPKYDCADPFHEGFAVVVLKGKQLFIDKSGNFVFSKKFDRALGFSQGFSRVAVLKAGELKFGLIDKSGNYAIQPTLTPQELNRVDSARIKKIISTQKVVEPVQLFQVENRFGFKNLAGDYVVRPIYQSANPFSEGLAMVQETTGLSGYVNESGAIAIEPSWASAEDFHEGRAVVGDFTKDWEDPTFGPGKKFGIIDRNGKFVIPKVLRGRNRYSEGFALIQPENADALEKIPLK